MYNKIASIILNSAKAAGLSDVYVAQPDSLKEGLAGKIFILAEIGGKKNEGRRIFDFLVNALSDNYYNDEKLLFRGKIDGLKIENIFEAAITKTNKNLLDFLEAEKIHINPSAASITVGVIYENKLHFTNFGHNRALLIYRHGENYEIINVEANAAEAPETVDESTAAAGRSAKIFSSVISGEVPLGSYFIFASEALPEYLSGKELLNIVTKLPPMTAAEQIKNVLLKMNTYVPFLGIIIKNTVGQNSLAEAREELDDNLSKHQPVSSLNYTEQKTEEMLAPAGLISFSKIFKKLKEWGEVLRKKPVSDKKRYLKLDEPSIPEPVDFGQVKSLKMARSDSFLIKEKIVFKKKPGWVKEAAKGVFVNFLNLFAPDSWRTAIHNLKAWQKALDRKNRWLFSALGLIVAVFAVSLIYTNWRQKQETALAEFNSLVAAIEDKEDSIDAHLLYADEAGAAPIITEAQSLLDSLPRKTAEQQNIYNRLFTRLSAVSDKIQKIVKVETADKFQDLSGLGANNLIFAAGKLYAAGAANIYELSSGSSSTTKTSISDAGDLTKPFFDKTDRLYYQDGGKIAQINIKTKASSLLAINELDQSALTAFNIFNSNLYVLAKDSNQIYRFNRSGNSFTAKSDWLKDSADFSGATAIGIDGDIYVLNADGRVLKFRKGLKVEYASGALSPAMTAADKMLVGANYIYILEGSSKRLAVLAKKDGHLMNQYPVNSLGQVKDMAIDEAGRSAYFLADEAVYKISLNQ